MQYYNYDSQQPELQTEAFAKPISLASIFGWMALALGITSAVAVGMYLLLGFGILPPEFYMPLMIGSMVGYFVIFFIINYRVMRQSNKSVLTPFLIYAGMMGVMLSSIMLYTAIDIIILAFLVSAVLFGTMAAYGAITKHNLTVMGSVASMAFMGAFILFPILWFFYNETLYWIITFVMFGAIMLITAYDTWLIQRQIAQGGMTKNMAIYFAMRLYINFINIFIRVLIFLSARRR